MKDIQNRTDIEFLVNTFYTSVKQDDIIGFFFTEVAALNFDLHLPKMYDFWESIIFKRASYDGNPMLSHIQLHKKSAIQSIHFERWLQLWEQTIKKYFIGENASEAIHRSHQIGQLIQLKIKI